MAQSNLHAAAVAASRPRVNNGPMKGYKQVARRTNRPAFQQVGRQGFSDLMGQWQGIAPATIAGHGDNGIGPVDIVQRQSNDFAGTQAKTRQQQQDGMIPSTYDRAATTASDVRTSGVNRAHLFEPEGSGSAVFPGSS